MKDQILKALESVRPYLQADDGDIEFVEITEDLIVKIKFLGTCSYCPLNQMTLRAGVERFLLREVPGIRRVEAVA